MRSLPEQLAEEFIGLEDKQPQIVLRNIVVRAVCEAIERCAKEIEYEQNFWLGRSAAGQALTAVAKRIRVLKSEAPHV